jgi:hypothetical protein
MEQPGVADSTTCQRTPAPSPGHRHEPTPQTLAKAGWSLSPPRIEIGAAERAAGGERAHALPAAGANMRADGTHAAIKQHADMQPITRA